MGYSYDDDTRLASVTQGTTTLATYPYDPAAQLETTTLANNTFETRSWDRAGRLVGVDTSVATGGCWAQLSYTYGDGLRQSSAVAGGPTTDASWDTNAALPRLAAEHDGTGTELRRYGYGLQRVSMTTPGATSYYHHDRMGSAVVLTDASGTTGWRYRYGAFGETRAPQGEGPHNPMRYTAEHLDDTGLYHLRARQYDPGTGRFLSTDPLAPPIDDPYVSAYVYVGNRPTVFTDPSGLCSVGPVRIGFLSNGNDSCRGAGVAEAGVDSLDEVSTVSSAVAAGAAGLTLVCPVCAPVTGPIAGVAGGVSLVTGLGATVRDCAVAGTLRDFKCASGVAVDLATGNAGRVIKVGGVAQGLSDEVITYGQRINDVFFKGVGQLGSKSEVPQLARNGK